MARLAVYLSLALAVLTSSPVNAAIQCGPTHQLMALLEKAGEKVIWQGIAGSHLAILTEHPVKKTWTFVGTSPEAISCIVAHGGDSEKVVPTPIPGPVS